MPTVTTIHTATDPVADYRLSTVAGWVVYELKGGDTLKQALASAAGGRSLAANAAYPIAKNGVLLRTEPEGWLLLGTAETVQKLLDTATENGYTVNATDGYRLMRLEGTGAAESLARFCSLDMRPEVFAPRHCARTPVAQVPVIVYRMDETTFMLVCPASYGDYLAQVLCAGY